MTEEDLDDRGVPRAMRRFLLEGIIHPTEGDQLGQRAYPQRARGASLVVTLPARSDESPSCCAVREMRERSHQGASERKLSQRLLTPEQQGQTGDDTFEYNVGQGGMGCGPSRSYLVVALICYTQPRRRRWRPGGAR